MALMLRQARHYGWSLIGLHWLTLLLIGAAFSLGLVLEDMPLSPFKLKLYAWHKWIGLLVLALLPLRMLLRYLDPLDRVRELVPWEARLSSLMHGMLYLLMFAAPLLGWLHSSATGFSVVWFGVLPLPDLVGKDKVVADMLKELHAGAVYALAGLVTLHALAAVYHHTVRRDQVLARMLPWLRKS
jgi:cytochrome b561